MIITIEEFTAWNRPKKKYEDVKLFKELLDKGHVVEIHISNSTSGAQDVAFLGNQFGQARSDNPYRIWFRQFTDINGEFELLKAILIKDQELVNLLKDNPRSVN